MAATDRSFFFESCGARLHAAVHRGGPGRPLVVVPGITTPAGAFAFAAAHWAATTGAGDVYVLDMRGRGLSERTPYGAHRAADYANDVGALTEQAGLSRPVLVGHSLGARVVAAARAQHPGGSSGMVAIDPPMSGPGRAPYPIGLDVFIRGIHGARAGFGVEQARQGYPTWSDEQVTQRGEWLGSCDEVAIVESYSWFHLEGFEETWSEVEPPALLLYGDKSPVVSEAAARALRGSNARAKVVPVGQSGHMVPWDNLQQTTAEISAFLKGLEDLPG